MATTTISRAEVGDSIEMVPIPLNSRKSIARIEKQSIKSTTAAPEEPANPVNAQSGKISNTDKLKLLSALLCFITAGINDTTLGPLIPYLQTHYKIGPGLVAIVYIPSFIGWLLAGAINTHLFHYIGQGGVLLVGAILQLASNVIRSIAPVYGLFAFSFFLAGAGIALQDSQANSYVAELPHAHNYLGLIHSGYGLGCLLAPLIATSIASNTPHWNFVYLVIVGLNLPNVALVGTMFRDTIYLFGKRPTPPTPTEPTATTEATDTTIESPPKTTSRTRTATANLLASLTDRAVYQMSLFYFFHLGAAISLSGWVVDFLVTIRGGNLTQMGYVPIGYTLGLTISRLLLPPLTFRFGEQRMVLLYHLLGAALLLIFWLVPNIIANAVALALLGFVLGPCFATGVSVATKLVERERVNGSLALIFVLGQAGGSIFPFVTGVVAEKRGVGVLQPIALALLVCAGVVWGLLPKVPGRKVE